MQAYFVDSSALVKAYQDEAGSERVLALLSSENVIIVSKLAHLEVLSALYRCGKTVNGIDPAAQAAASKFEKEFLDTFVVIELTDEIFDDAAALVRDQLLRAADA